MKQDEFVIRTYGKSELAMLYFPHLGPKAAQRKLNNWFRINPRLTYLINKNIKDYTPRQVQQIVEEVGEPERFF